MYDYRRWTAEQRATAVAERKQRGYPWHSPPHLKSHAGFRIITGTCFEHARILSNPKRLTWFEEQLLLHLKKGGVNCGAWVVLPNHYLILAWIDNIEQFTLNQGQFHGRMSFVMNREDNQIGRKVWYRCQDRCMRNESHYYATLNYIHNNPVKHKYIEKWGDWPYSSVHWYLEHRGHDWLLDLWREYPVLNYGDSWDV